MEMPAEYMFKEVPHYEDDEVEDPIQVVLAGMETHGITKFLVGVHENEHSKRAVREHPDRFAGMLNVDPNTGMDAVRSIDAAIEEWGASLRAVHCWGTGLNPQVPLGDKMMYPVYAKCVEVGLPIIVLRRRARTSHPGDGPAPDAARRGVLVLPRAPDRVAPRCRAMDRADGEAAPQVARAALLHERVRAEVLPRDIIEFANSRGADKVIYAGYYAGGAVPRPVVRGAALGRLPRPRLAEVPPRERTAGLRPLARFSVTPGAYVCSMPVAGEELRLKVFGIMRTSAHKALRELRVEGLSPQGAERLLDEVIAIEKAMASLKVLIADRAAESRAWAARGARSAEDDLANRMGTSTSQAKDVLSSSKRVQGQPKVEGALRDGKLSEKQASLITDAAAANPDAEQSLLDAAAEESLGGLRDKCGRVKAAADRDPEATNRRIHAERYLRYGKGTDGAVNGSFQVDPASGRQARCVPATVHPGASPQGQGRTAPRHPRPAVRRRLRGDGRSGGPRTGDQDDPAPGQRDRRPRRPPSWPHRG